MPQVNVKSQEIAEGVWFMGGGSHNSVLVEFPTYLTMIEGPLGDSRSLAVIAEAKKLVPGKPIKYLINSHHHFDHLGGVRAYVAEGATIITNEMNVAFYEKIFSAPHSLAPDELAKNPKKAKFETIGEKKEYSDGTRTVVFYHVPGAPHSNGLTFAYLPKEKVLFQGDFTVTPGEPANDHVKALGPVLARLNLDYDKYIPVHAGATPLTKKDVDKALGK